ncbi:MAG: hypothetical protein PWP27_79 [Clostridiales bacterium]|jgi:hypothetical protein|nr:hypothetical protein [Clostridiales bacterium]MDK2932269.1 hypothetical protein [Clostridiales bacterium]
MYTRVYERLIKNSIPFHQKVLRYHYNLPLENLKQVLTLIIEVISQNYSIDVVYKTKDRLEYDGRLYATSKKLPLSQLCAILGDEQLLYNFGKQNGWVKVGLFNNDIDWYLRIFIENECNLSSGEPRIENIELFTNEQLLSKIMNKLMGQSVGHIIIEGAKKYIEEIYI